MRKVKDWDMGFFDNGEYVFRQVPYLDKDDALFTASLEDRFNKPTECLIVTEDYCRHIPGQWANHYTLMNGKSGKGAFKVWVVSIKEQQ